MMKYDEVVVKMRKGHFDPVYLFVGEEDFLKEEAIRLITSTLIDPTIKDFNFDLLYGSETDAATAMDMASSFPLMAERRLVLFRDIQHCSPKDRKILLNYAAHPLQTTCLVLVGPKVDLRKGFYRDLSKAATTVVFWPLFDNQIPSWIRKRLQGRNKKISSKALTVLQNLVGSNLQELANEIDKLLIYISERETINQEDVETVVGMTKTHSVYDLAESVAEKRHNDSLQILHSLLDSGETEGGIIWTLTRHFSTLVKIRELQKHDTSAKEIARKIKTRQSLMNSYLRQSRSYSPPQFERAFQLLLAADAHLKSSYQHPKLTMEIMVHRLCRLDE